MIQMKCKSYTNKETGLNLQEIQNAKRNIAEDSISKSYSKILKQHVFTFFNVVNILLATLVIFTGSYRNMLFMLVVLINAIVGLIQEIRSKKTLDKLSLLHQQKIHVLRQARSEHISIYEVVENDILLLQAGDQVPCDCLFIEGNIECDESMITGESDAIEKQPDDTIYSGSFILAGQGKAQVLTVGNETYASSMTQQAKREKRYPSQLRDSIQFIIRTSTIVLVPAGILLFLKQFFVQGSSLNDSILSTVAAMVGMIPEGLVLLTSIALSVGVIKLSKQQVLVQELYCIETLARVDTLCLDKTGTITQGKMKVQHIKTNQELSKIQQILSNMSHSLNDENQTAKAIRDYIKNIEPTWISQDIVPFSSARKISQVTYQSDTYILGAYPFIFEKQDPKIIESIQNYSKQGYRTLTLVKNKEILALILIQDALRPNTKKILTFFKEQNVDLKILSGDDKNTVAALAKEAGIQGRSIDMSQVKTIDDNLLNYSIYGRVTPIQKCEILKLLKKNGHTVAMTGDGVNDVMALKEADCSIAMGSGSEATKKIASIVLLQDQFEALPLILHQGRCIINNIQRTASLFLVKTLFSFGLSILTLLWISEYPFQPIQLTLISALATGIPSFILTLEPNATRVEGNFLINVFSRALPGAICVIVSVFITHALRLILHIHSDQFSTICTMIAGFNALCVLVGACIPLTKLRKILVLTMISIFGMIVLFFNEFFYLVPISFMQLIYILITCSLIPGIQRFLNVWFKQFITQKRSS